MTTPEPLDALRHAAEVYEMNGPSPEVDSLARVAQAQQLARIADAVTEIVGVVRVALTPAAPPVGTGRWAVIQSWAKTIRDDLPPDLEGVDGAASPVRPLDGAVLDDPPEPDVEVRLEDDVQPRGWATGYCCRAPFSRVPSAVCWHCGHGNRLHRDDGRRCLGCLAHQAQPDPAAVWLRENAGQVVAALRAHADVLEDEASRGIYGGDETALVVNALAQGQRARAIRVQELTT